MKLSSLIPADIAGRLVDVLLVAVLVVAAYFKVLPQPLVEQLVGGLLIAHVMVRRQAAMAASAGNGTGGSSSDGGGAGSSSSSGAGAGEASPPAAPKALPRIAESSGVLALVLALLPRSHA